MDTRLFTSQSPGHLEPTSFTEHLVTEEGLTVRDVEGVGFVPDPLPPRLDHVALRSDLLDDVLTAERALSELNAGARRMENPHLLTGIFSQREAILSSKIEDTYASATQIKLIDLDPSLFESDRQRNDAREVRNYVRALNHGLNSELPICLRLIREMHAILLEGVAARGVQPGEFRGSQNHIGGGGSFGQARFVPPPPRFLRSLLKDFEGYCHVRDSPIPRLARFAMLHYQFETIHPFLDGNGRIGRLLITLMLCEQAQLAKPLVYVSGYIERNREEYYELLHRVSTRGEWLAWIRYFLRALSTQAADALTRSDRLIDLQSSFKQAVQEKRASALLPKLVDHLFMSPVITVGEAAQACGCTPQNASQLLGRLMSKSIVVEVTGRATGRVFQAPAIINLIMSEEE